nr:hypothetical protein BaRGS_033404 [Batillaria attramentaria]
MFDGCSVRFPKVIPPLTPEETAARTMQAILTNQKQVCIPRIIYTFAVLKMMLPVSAMTEVTRFFGADTFMDSYVGRQGDKAEHSEDLKLE